MAASFRSVEEVEALAGCDRLTISPALLDELANDHGTLVRKLEDGHSTMEARTPLSQMDFRWALNEDAMATAKLSEGIRVFASDLGRLNELLETRWSGFDLEAIATGFPAMAG